MQAAFLYLDHLLGEDDVERWIGAIELLEAPAGGCTPAELKAEVARRAAEPPEESWINGERTRPDGQALNDMEPAYDRYADAASNLTRG